MNNEEARQSPGQFAADTHYTPDHFWAGYLCGYRQCEVDEQAWWSELARKVHQQADRVSFAELERRRLIDPYPCPRECGRCSRCIHSLALRKRGYVAYTGEVRHG